MIVEKDSFRLIVYLSIVLVVVIVALLAWYKGK